MKNKWLGAVVFVAMIAGFGSCYRPYGYHHGYSDYYSDYYSYGRGYYGHGEYMRRDRGRARYRLMRPDSRYGYYSSRGRTARRPRGRDRDRDRW